MAQEPQTVCIAMRDGIELVGDLYLPEGLGPFPTLVTKTPYPREGVGVTAAAQYWAANGYAFLVVSMRGRFDSGGIFYQRRNEGWLEHKDGYDTIEWAAQQPWSTGDIGTTGGSAGAQWQLTTAPTRPPHLRAMYCSVAGNHRHGGRVERGIHTSTALSLHHNQNIFPRPLRTRDDYLAWLADWQRSQLPLLMTFIHPEIVDQFVHTAYDDYWRESDPATRYEDVEVPVSHVGGWYDKFIGATLQSFTGIRARARSAKARQWQKLIIGPWTHGGAAPETDTVKFGPAATQGDGRASRLRWFDYWLKGIDTGISEDPPVRVYLMGAERWLESDSWPLPGTHYVTYYLGAGRGRPRHSLNDGRLSSEAPGSRAPDEYVHDPYDPLPSIGGHGAGGLDLWPAGPADHRPAESRSLTFSTDVLQEDLEVVGEVRARFFASSSAVDTDFVLTLSDVYPNGYSAVLRQNGMRARYRLSEETESLLTPHQVYEFNLTMDGIANLFKAGHRLRLTIASSSFPAFLPNPGTEGPLHLATKGVTAHNAVYHDSQHPSTIELPVLDPELIPAGQPHSG